MRTRTKYGARRSAEFVCPLHLVQAMKLLACNIAGSDQGKPKLLPPSHFLSSNTRSRANRSDGTVDEGRAEGDADCPRVVESDAVLDRIVDRSVERGAELRTAPSATREQRGSPAAGDADHEVGTRPARLSQCERPPPSLQPQPGVHIEGAGGFNVTGGNVTIAGPMSFGSSQMHVDGSTQATGSSHRGNSFDTRNVLWSFNREVASRIGRDIFTLAALLEIDQSFVDEVNYNYPRDLRGACQAIMKEYQRQWGLDQEGAKATLMRALRDETLRRNDIADRIV